MKGLSSYRGWRILKKGNDIEVIDPATKELGFSRTSNTEGIPTIPELGAIHETIDEIENGREEDHFTRPVIRAEIERRAKIIGHIAPMLMEMHQAVDHIELTRAVADDLANDIYEQFFQPFSEFSDRPMFK